MAEVPWSRLVEGEQITRLREQVRELQDVVRSQQEVLRALAAALKVVVPDIPHEMAILEPGDEDYF